MKKYIKAAHNYEKLGEFHRKVMYNSDYKTMPYADLKAELTSILQQQDIGDAIQVDDRQLGGFRSSTMGNGYTFRKVASNRWHEVFDECRDLTDSELADKELRSEAFKRRLRW